MPEPNIISAATLVAKTIVASDVGVTPVELVANESNNALIKVSSLICVNKTNSTVGATVVATLPNATPGSSSQPENFVDVYLANDAEVPATERLIAINRLTPLYLEKSTALAVYADTADGLDVICSYTVISGTNTNSGGGGGGGGGGCENITWSTRTTNSTTPASTWWSDITYGNNIFVLGFTGGSGNRGYMTSTDGNTWVDRTFPSAINTTHAIAFNNGVFVALDPGLNVGNVAAKAYKSSDGITWSTPGATLSGPYQLGTVFSGNDKFYALGVDLSETVNGYINTTWRVKLQISTDGATWTSAKNLHNNLFDNFVYSFYSWVQLSSSYNGTSAIYTPDNYVDVLAADGKLVAIGAGVPDGDVAPNWGVVQDDGTWPYSSTFIQPTYNEHWKLTAGNDVFVRVYKNRADYSTDGLSWTETTLPDFTATGVPVNVLFGNGTFVALTGSGKVYLSSDGITWTSGAGPGSGYTRLYYDGSNFIAIKNNSDISASYAGTTWTQTGSAATLQGTLSTYTIPNEVVIDNGTITFFARTVAPNLDVVVVRSTNSGSTWTTAAPNNINAAFRETLAYGGGTFVTFGRQVGCFYSADGINWTNTAQELINTDNNWRYSLQYINGLFVLRGTRFRAQNATPSWLVDQAQAFIAVSSDGITWTKQNINGLTFVASAATSSVIDALTYLDGMYLLAAYVADSDVRDAKRGRVLVTTTDLTSAYGRAALTPVVAQSDDDGETWTLTPTTGLDWYSANYFTTATNYRALSRQMLTYGNGVYVALYYDIPSEMYTVAHSTDAINWTKVSGDPLNYVASLTSGTSFGGATYPKYRFFDLKYLGGQFVAIGYWVSPSTWAGICAKSTDGQTWTITEMGDTAPMVITYGNGKYVTAGLRNPAQNKADVATGICG